MVAQTAAKHSPTPQTPSLPQAKPESIGLSTARLQLMSDAFKREIDKGTLPGATVMVARRGQIGWFEALGKQSPAASAPMAKDSIFRIFSMTKPIVSVGIMMLIEDGHFLLSDPVAKFIPEFADQKVGVENNGKLDLVPVKRPMTVQDLLRHTSGITYDHTGNGLVQHWMRRPIGRLGHTHVHHDEIVARSRHLVDRQADQMRPNQAMSLRLGTFHTASRTMARFILLCPSARSTNTIGISRSLNPFRHARTLISI